MKGNVYLCELKFVKRLKKKEIMEQQAYVKESLERAFQDVKMAKLEGKPLQDVDDFLKELD